MLAEELRRAGLGSRAQELLQALSCVVRGTLLETVRPAVDFEAPVNAGLVHRLVGDELVHHRALVELHEKGCAERVAAVVGDKMAVADDAHRNFRRSCSALPPGCAGRPPSPARPSSRSPTAPACCGS